MLNEYRRVTWRYSHVYRQSAVQLTALLLYSSSSPVSLVSRGSPAQPRSRISSPPGRFNGTTRASNVCSSLSCLVLVSTGPLASLPYSSCRVRHLPTLLSVLVYHTAVNNDTIISLIARVKFTYLPVAASCWLFTTATQFHHSTSRRSLRARQIRWIYTLATFNWR